MYGHSFHSHKQTEKIFRELNTTFVIKVFGKIYDIAMSTIDIFHGISWCFQRALVENDKLIVVLLSSAMDPKYSH